MVWCTKLLLGFMVLVWNHPNQKISLLAQAQASYSNVTLRAKGGDLSAVVYLPEGLKPHEPTYYKSSRFDHGSMIGPIERVHTSPSGERRRHVLYGNTNWRVPHDPYWPESGVGLASEFGVGDDGAFCNWRCGWYGVNEVDNGVLGYRTAKNGESFLKIGVGELIKGSCTSCDSTDDFKFNSPYRFAKRPLWTLEEHPESNTVSLIHQAVLNENGYQLRKDITLNDDELLVKSTLTNIGRIPFATAWYSHHFFTCDDRPVGSGYAVDLDLTGTEGQFEEPGTWFWSTPLESYANIDASKGRVSVEMQRGVEQNVRIKAEFVKDSTSKGGFILRGCGTSIKETIPEVGTEGGVSMYAYNLYIESSTFSPEPQIYMHLWPGQTTSWTQKLEFADDQGGWFEDNGASSSHRHGGFSFFGFLLSRASGDSTAGTRLFSSTTRRRDELLRFGMLSMTVILLTLFVHGAWNRRRRRLRQHEYAPIPDLES